MANKKNIPQKGAAKKLAAKLKKLGKQKPPEALVEKLNRPLRTYTVGQRFTSIDGTDLVVVLINHGGATAWLGEAEGKYRGIAVARMDAQGKVTKL